MTVDPRRFRRHRNARHHAKTINIRLRRHRSLGGEPTREEVIDAIEYILAHGRVPAGWQFAMIEWQNPMRASLGWVDGTLRDFDTLAPIIQEALYDARISLVRPE